MMHHIPSIIHLYTTLQYHSSGWATRRTGTTTTLLLSHRLLPPFRRMRSGVRGRNRRKSSSSNGIVHRLKVPVINVLVLLVVTFFILSSRALSASVLSLAYLVTSSFIPALSKRKGRNRKTDATENALRRFDSQLVFPVYLAIAVAVAVTCVDGSLLGWELGGRSRGRDVEWRRGRVGRLYYQA